MNDDDIRRLAQEAGLTYTDSSKGGLVAYGALKEDVDLTPTLRAFAHLVEAATITRCADVCDDVASECASWEEGGEHGSSAAQWCGSKVRALNPR